MGIGSNVVRVALLPSYLRMVELVEGAGERACGVSVVGDLCSLRCVTVHNTDGRWILMVELAIRE